MSTAVKIEILAVLGMLLTGIGMRIDHVDHVEPSTFGLCLAAVWLLCLVAWAVSFIVWVVTL